MVVCVCWRTDMGLLIVGVKQLTRLYVSYLVLLVQAFIFSILCTLDYIFSLFSVFINLLVSFQQSYLFSKGLTELDILTDIVTNQRASCTRAAIFKFDGNEHLYISESVKILFKMQQIHLMEPGEVDALHSVIRQTPDPFGGTCSSDV